MKYYLLDSSAIIYHYIPSEYPSKTSKIDYLIQEKQEGKAFLFMTNFCIAEVFNTFAKYHFRYKDYRNITQEDYEKCREDFKDAIHNAKLIYHYELNRYHILDVDYIVPFEHQYYPIRKRQEKEKKWFLSTFDILFISAGIELVRMLGFENVYLVADEVRIMKICNVLRKLSPQVRKDFKIPSYIIYPRVKLLSSL